jgi:hypothetical protein
MSKKTNAEKHKRLTTRPRRRVRVRKRINIGPRKPIKRDANVTTSELLFADPYFMHHLAGALFRAMELMGKVPPNLTDADIADLEYPLPHQPDLGPCRNCGKTAAEAHEDSMGMCCVESADFMHRFGPKQEMKRQ